MSDISAKVKRSSDLIGFKKPNKVSVVVLLCPRIENIAYSIH